MHDSVRIAGQVVAQAKGGPEVDEPWAKTVGFQEALARWRTFRAERDKVGSKQANAIPEASAGSLPTAMVRR